MRKTVISYALMGQFYQFYVIRRRKYFRVYFEALSGKSGLQLYTKEYFASADKAMQWVKTLTPSLFLSTKETRQTLTDEGSPK